jgi:predicted dehydrogenase
VERQASKKKPRLFTDYREMLKQKDLDMVEVATPDHWHALPMIEAAKAGCDMYVQKPISVDIVEGQAMLAAARKYNRVVQIGTQRRSTPHLIEARDIVKQGKLGVIGHVEIFSYGGGRPTNPQPAPVPDTLDWDFWLGPAPVVPFSPEIERNWRAYMAYGNGTIGDMGVHMFDMVRWFMDLGWPKRVSSFGGIRVLKSSKSDISDDQTSMFEFDNLTVVWRHRHFGAQPDPDYNWGAILYGDKGTLKAGLMGYDFIPIGGNAPKVHKDVVYELEQFPVDKTEPRLEPHEGSSGEHRQPRKAGRRHRAGLHFVVVLHPGQHVHATRPHSPVGRPEGRGGGRRRSQPALAPPVPQTLGASGGQDGLAPCPAESLGGNALG